MKKTLQIIISYAALAIVLTWPLLLHITTAFPSTFSTGGDPNFYISFMNLSAKSLTHQLPVSLNQMVYYPSGSNWLTGYEAPIILVLAVPVIWLTHNPILAYNFVLLTAMVLACLTCYFLVRHLTKSDWPALICGFAFGLSPFMLVRGLQHINLTLLFCLPLMVLASLKFFEKLNLKSAFFLAFTVLVAALCTWYYLLSGLLFLLLMLLFDWQKFLEYWRIFLLAGFLIFAAVGITSLPIILSQTKSSQAISDLTIDKSGSQILSLVLPHPFADIWRPLTANVYSKFPSVYVDNFHYPYFEQTSYIGIVGIIALAILLFFRRKIPVTNGIFWLTAIVIFLVLSLGNFVQIFGLKIPMPFALLHKIYPFDHLRAANRFFVVAFLAMIVTFGYFLAWLQEQLPPRQFGIIASLIICLMITERIILPYPLTTIVVSQFYKNLASDNSKFALADLPVISTESEYNYYQVYHNKPIVDGEIFWPSYSNQTFSFINSNQLLRGSLVCNPNPSDLNDKKQALANLDNQNIRYIVVHNFELQSVCINQATFIRKFFAGVKPIFTDGEITVYSTKP